MSTSKLLTTPKIIEIIGSTIRIAHPDLKNNIRTTVASDLTAAGTSLTVADNNGFNDDDWFILGDIGDPNTEECDVNGAVTRGQSLTITNSTKFNHGLDCGVTRIHERGIKIYGAATDGGAGTLIASIDVVTTPIADAKMIQWNRPHTEHTLITTDTTYAYYFVKFTDGTTDSSASDYVASSGVVYNAIDPLIREAFDMTGAGENRFMIPYMVQWAQNCQDAITQYFYRDPISNTYHQKDWSFEVIKDSTSITVSENENVYALSSLTTAAKYPNSLKSIISIQMGTEKPLKKLSIQEFDEEMVGKPRVDLTVEATAGATSITSASFADFAESGSFYLGGDICTYTTKAATTLSGIPASGTGAITETHAVGSAVWQNNQPSKPTSYTIHNGSIYLNKPVHEDYEGQALKITYFKAIPRITSQSDVTEVPFTNVFPLYLAAKIEFKNRNFNEANTWMDQFNKQVLACALADYIPISDYQTYYTYADGVYSDINNDDDT